MTLLKPVDEDKLIKVGQGAIASRKFTDNVGAGLLSTVVPVDELKTALYENLDKLVHQLRESEHPSLRGIT